MSSSARREIERNFELNLTSNEQISESIILTFHQKFKETTYTEAWGFFLEKSHASPKSDILTWPFSSKSMLAGCIKIVNWWIYVDSTYLEVTVDDKSFVHMLETEDNFRGVKFHILFRKDSMLWQVVVKVSSIHEIEDET